MSYAGDETDYFSLNCKPFMDEMRRGINYVTHLLHF